MFINYNYLYSHELSDKDLEVLLKVRQKETILLEVVEDVQETLDWLETKELIQYVKGDKGGHTARVSIKGNRFLKNLEKPEYREEYGELASELISIYQSYDKFTGNKTNVEKRLTWFINESGFSLPIIRKAVDEYLLNADPKYVLSLENLCWKPASVYDKTMKLVESRLYNLIVEKYGLDEGVLESKDKSICWLSDLSKLKVPKNINPKFYLTENYEEDCLLLSTIKEKYLELLKNKR